LVLHEDEVLLKGGLGEGRGCGSKCLEGHKSCDVIFHGNGEQGVEVIHAAEIACDDVGIALYVSKLERIGLQV
jgi:hypothetical protein